MRKWVLVAYDIVVLSGFGIYLALTLWRLPAAVRHRIFVVSVGGLTRLAAFWGCSMK